MFPYHTGDPVDVYSYGIIYWVYAISYVLGYIPIGYFIAPAYHKEGLTSAYEVLKLTN